MRWWMLIKPIVVIISQYNWPVSNMRLNCMSPLYADFFNRYTVIPLYPGVLHLQIHPVMDPKRYFRPKAGNLGIQRADCMCSLIPFYIRDLRIRALGVCRWSWHHPLQIQGKISFPGVKVTWIFLNTQGFCALKPHVFLKGQLCI